MGGVGASQGEVERRPVAHRPHVQVGGSEGGQARGWAALCHVHDRGWQEARGAVVDIRHGDGERSGGRQGRSSIVDADDSGYALGPARSLSV